MPSPSVPPTPLVVGLVGCGAAKRPVPCPARDLYTGGLFAKTSAYAEQACDQWFVLSAKHGLVHPETVLAPYDMRLGDRRTGPPIWDWVALVMYGLLDRFDPQTVHHFVVLAGGQYRTVLHEFPPAWTYAVPLAGLGIGQQLAWLSAATAQPVAAQNR